MKVREMFPRKYVQGEDLQGVAWRLTVRGVGEEQMTDPQNRSQKREKWVVRFQEIRQGVILNSTRAMELQQALDSDDTEDWIGEQVTLYTKKEECFGQIWDVLHFRAVQADDEAPGRAAERQRNGGNGRVAQEFERFLQSIVNTIPFYENADHVKETLKACEYETFKVEWIDEMRRKLEEYAEQHEDEDDLPF